MEAYIFDNIGHIKEHVGGGANLSLDLSSLKPTILATYRNHLQIWIGDALWNDLVGAATPNAAQTALIEQLRTPLAMLSLHEYSKIGSVQFGEMGLHRTETEERRTAFKYQETEWRDYMLRNGYEALEALLEFLEANIADYPLWAGTAGQARKRSLYINSAKDFRNAYSMSVDRYTYESFRGLMGDVETFAVLPVLGQAQHDALKTAIADADVSADEADLIALVQKAVAYFTIELAAVQKWVTIKHNMVVNTEVLEPQGYARQGNPSGPAIDAVIAQNNLLANRHVSYIKHWLSTRLEDFPSYATYLEAEAAAADTASLPIEQRYTAEREFGAHNLGTSSRHDAKRRVGLKRL